VVLNSQTYERSAITAWLQREPTCPRTRAVVAPNAPLHPNVALKSIINEWVEANGAPTGWYDMANTSTDCELLCALASHGVYTDHSRECLRAEHEFLNNLIERMHISAQRQLERRRAAEASAQRIGAALRLIRGTYMDRAEMALRGEEIKGEPAINVLMRVVDRRREGAITVEEASLMAGRVLRGHDALAEEFERFVHVAV